MYVQLGGQKKWTLHKRPVHAARLIQIQCTKWRLSRLRWMSYHVVTTLRGYDLLLMIPWTSIMNIYILYHFVCVNSRWYGPTFPGTLYRCLCYSCFSPRYPSSASTKQAKTALWLWERKDYFCLWTRMELPTNCRLHGSVKRRFIKRYIECGDPREWEAPKQNFGRCWKSNSWHDWRGLFYCSIANMTLMQIPELNNIHPRTLDRMLRGKGNSEVDSKKATKAPRTFQSHYWRVSTGQCLAV